MNLPTKDIILSATPSDAEIAAWNALSRDEQIELLRQHLKAPACTTPSNRSMDDILAEARARAAQRSRV